MCEECAKPLLTELEERRTLNEDADPEPQRARPPRCEAAPPIAGRLSGRPAKGSSKRPGTASTSLSGVSCERDGAAVGRSSEGWQPMARSPVGGVRQTAMPPAHAGASHKKAARLLRVTHPRGRQASTRLARVDGRESRSRAAS